MNPIDHPHGGNTTKGRHPQSPWGKLAKGGKTRKFPIVFEVIYRRKPKRQLTKK